MAIGQGWRNQLVSNGTRLEGQWGHQEGGNGDINMAAMETSVGQQWDRDGVVMETEALLVGDRGGWQWGQHWGGNGTGAGW